MSDLTARYLRLDVQIEPLVNRWHAWPYLISPVTGALICNNDHLRLMRAFLSAPHAHAELVRNPDLKGGPFVDVDVTRTGEVEALLRETERAQAPWLELACALAELNEHLLAAADGRSLASLYASIPRPLRGYVELVYDLNCRPSFRLIEPLLYRSRYHDPGRQSLALSLADQVRRSFIFSTPRLPTPAALELPVAFDHPLVDELAKLRLFPRPLEELRELLGLPSSERSALERLTTTEAPHVAPTNARPEGLRVRYLGHASLLIETREVSIILDPLVGYSAQGALRYSDLPAHIDYALLTHNHPDHVVLETLLQLRHRIGTVIVPPSSGSLFDPSLKLALQSMGFKSVCELSELQSVTVAGGEITAIPFFGEHGDLDIRAKTAYLLRLGDRKLLCTADSANLDPEMYRHLHQVVGDVDSLFVGMECDGAPVSWMYGALLLHRLSRQQDQSRRLCASDAAQAWDIVQRFNCRDVFVYAMGQERWLDFITSIEYTEQSKPIVESNKLLELCRRAGIRALRLHGAREVLLEHNGLSG